MALNSSALKSKKLQYLKPLMFVLIAGYAIFYLSKHFGEFNESLQTIRKAQIKPLVLVIFWTSITYFMSSLVIMGAATKKLSYLKTIRMSLASSAIGKFTPKGVGAAIYMEQYLESNKLSRAQAASSTSLVYLAGVIVHLSLTLIYIQALNPSLIDDIDLSAKALIIAGIVVVASTICISQIKYFASMKVRLNSGIKKSLITIKTISKNPYKIFQVFGGSIGVTICYGLAFYYSAEAFGSALQLKEMILIYLGAGIVSSAAPTPGGLGAVEASLSAGLVLAGMPIPQSVSTVAVFRLVTFWLPIIPGFFALNRTNLKPHY